MSSKSRRSRIDGLALFAGAMFAIGLATIMALERVGAPGGLVRAIGPVVTLLGVSIVGVGAHNADLASFMAAGRRVPSFYGGLSAVAIAAGIAVCLYPDLKSPSDPPLLGFFAGATLGVMAYGPLIRRFGATSLADIIATRFSSSPLRLSSAIVIWMTGALTALAGFQVAVLAIQALLPSNRWGAEVIVALVLIFSVTPGGMAGFVSSAAASAGALLMIALVGVLAGWRTGMSPPDLSTLAPASSTVASPTAFGPTIATMLATASLFAFAPGAIVSRNPGGAIRAGILAFFLCLALAGLTDAALSVFPIGLGSSYSSPVAASLIGAATLASALALSSLGLQGSSRALGVALADPPKRFPTLASVRLARIRAVQVAIVVGCAVCDGKGFLDSRTALIFAMALSLAMTTPLVALAAVARVGANAAFVAMLTAIAVGIFGATTMKSLPSAANLFEGALAVAAVAFVAGALTSIVAPRQRPAPTPGAFDPFAKESG